MVEVFLKANSDPELIAGDRLVLDKVVVDQANKTVEATAYVDVDLFFPLFRLGDTQRVDNISAAIYSDKKIEVAMMLDVTGSMGERREGQDRAISSTLPKNAVTRLCSQTRIRRTRAFASRSSPMRGRQYGQTSQ